MSTDLADVLLWQLRVARVEAPAREVRFGGLTGKRRWRFDLAWTDRHLAVECDGGIWIGGRHTRGAGAESDCEKISEAVALGWRVMRVSQKMIEEGRALELVELALG